MLRSFYPSPVDRLFEVPSLVMCKSHASGINVLATVQCYVLGLDLYSNITMDTHLLCDFRGSPDL